MALTKKILKIATNVLLWALIALTALLMIFMLSVKVSGKQPTFFGLGFYQIVSGSMSPEVKAGDVIVGKSCGASDLTIGDNIIFNYNNVIVTHKLIEISDGYLITHGVANPLGSNEKIAPNQVIARQVFNFAGLGYLLNFLRSPFGFILIIAVPIGGLIIYQTFSLTKRLKQYKNSEEQEESEEKVLIKKEIEQLKQRLDNPGSVSVKDDASLTDDTSKKAKKVISGAKPEKTEKHSKEGNKDK